MLGLLTKFGCCLELSTVRKNGYSTYLILTTLRVDGQDDSLASWVNLVFTNKYARVILFEGLLRSDGAYHFTLGCDLSAGRAVLQ